jgi:hypothetical protein
MFDSESDSSGDLGQVALMLSGFKSPEWLLLVKLLFLDGFWRHFFWLRSPNWLLWVGLLLLDGFRRRLFWFHPTVFFFNL